MEPIVSGDAERGSVQPGRSAPERSATARRSNKATGCERADFCHSLPSQLPTLWFEVPTQRLLVQ